jgi:hypothetical protein
MSTSSCIAFLGERRIAEGDLRQVARALKAATDINPGQPVLIFDLQTSETIEIDLRGAVDEVLARLPHAADPEDAGSVAAPEDVPPRGPGRPRLGVVAREVTLLPRHWDWLNAQPGGASVTIRKLVEQARIAQAGRDCVRRATDATYRFAQVMAGNLRDYEEAMRALFAGDRTRFEAMTESWPVSIRNHARRLAAPAFGEAPFPIPPAS